MIISFTEIGQTLGRAGLRAEMKCNFGYIEFANSSIIQVKSSGRHLLESRSQGRNQD